MYTLSKLEICNAVLNRIGNNNLISSLDEESAESIVLVNQYDVTLAAILRSFPWRFARRVAEMSESTEDVIPGWTYAFAVPGDCIKVQRVLCTEDLPVEKPVKYDMMAVSSGWIIYTDIESASVEYTAWVEDPGLWDASFVEAFTLKLAAVVCLVLTASDSKASEMMKLSQYAWQNATIQTVTEARTTSNIKRSRYRNARR